MGYFKDRDVERLQTEMVEAEAERVAHSFLQPTLSKEFSYYPEADSLLDFVQIFKRRQLAALNIPELALTLAN